MPKYFDIHSHINDSAYDSDLDLVIKRLKETETHTIVVGTDWESSKRAVDLAEKYEEIYASIGIHPIDSQSKNSDISLFSELVGHPKVVAIGECGMDFFRTPRSLGEVGQSEYERQKKLFLEQVDFALAYNKPLMIHVRDAYEELLALLKPLKKEYGEKLRGNVHFFAGDSDIAKRFFDMGFSISFTGVITFPPPGLADPPALADTYEVIRNAPLDRIMTETDSPYVTPVPHRGKRNEPSYVNLVAKKIAEIRGEDEEIVRDALVNNALSMIG